MNEQALDACVPKGAFLAHKPTTVHNPRLDRQGDLELYFMEIWLSHTKEISCTDIAHPHRVTAE